MADYVAAHITIGGAVRKQIVPELCDAICRQGVSLDWGEFDFCPAGAQDLLDACREFSRAKILRLYGDEVAYGNLDLLQECLALHEVPFDRWHEAKYDIACELMVYRPQEELRFFSTNQQEEIVVRAEPLMRLAALLQEAQTALRTGRKQNALQVVRRCQHLVAEHLPPAIPPVPALQIIAQ